MRKTKLGDQILVHYTKRFADGVQASSRSGDAEPLAVTVGAAHPRLPGLGQELVGLAPGENTSVAVPAGRAIAADPKRVGPIARSRFVGQTLTVGRRARLACRSGQIRSVRVVSEDDRFVVVDANHPRAGQGVELEVEVIAFLPGVGAAG
jgi:peptidylprolyl isomerase